MFKNNHLPVRGGYIYIRDGDMNTMSPRFPDECVYTW
jgi:hypothetical protein